MIIDNVKVYTPDQKFVEGGLVLDQDRIEAVYTNETKPDFFGKRGSGWRRRLCHSRADRPAFPRMQGG